MALVSHDFFRVHPRIRVADPFFGTPQEGETFTPIWFLRPSPNLV